MCRLVDDLMARTQELLQPNPGTYIIHIYILVYTVQLLSTETPTHQFVCLVIVGVTNVVKQFCSESLTRFICNMNGWAGDQLLIVATSTALLYRREKAMENGQSDG